MSNTKKVRSADTPISYKQSRIGRPRTRFEKMEVLSTRCPEHIANYLKAIVPFRYHSLIAMFDDMLSRFIDAKPWEHGMLWRKTKSPTARRNGVAEQTAWVQTNIVLPSVLNARVKAMADLCGVSKACFAYTAIFWWVQQVYPPKNFLKKE